MGRIVGNVIGEIRGKIGNVVGGSWKGTSYLRQLVIPSNPKTVAQMQQRDKFRLVLAIAKQSLTQVIKPFWDPFFRNISGFNAFMRANLLAMPDAFLASSLIACIGSLEGLADLSKSYVTGTGVLTVSWDQQVNGNGHTTDFVGVLVYDTAKRYCYYSIAQAHRDDSSIAINTRSGGTISDFETFAWTYRTPDDLPYIQSTSNRCQS